MKHVNNKNRNRQIGFIGEGLSKTFLVKHGLCFICSNFRTRVGEIDLILKDANMKLHFVEVKTVSRETLNSNFTKTGYLSFKPEDNITKQKIKKIYKTAQIFIEQNPIFKQYNYQIDAVTVILKIIDLNKIEYSVLDIKYIQNVNL